MQVSAQQPDDAIAREIERVIAREVDDQRLKALLSRPGGFDEALWSLATRQGWAGLALPESSGGLGLSTGISWRDLAELSQVLGRATVSLPLLQNSLLATLLLEADNRADFSASIQALAAGECLATLVLGGADDAGLPDVPPVIFDAASANRNQGTLTGQTSFSAFAAVANLALVRARHQGREVLALAHLNENVDRECVELVDNARAAAALSFHETPATLLVESRDALNAVLAPAVVISAFEQIGGASASMELARDFALEHRAFGQPIGAFQAIKHKIADIYTAIEIARGCALQALEELEQGELSLKAACAARISANRAYDFATQEAIQVHGGMGITWEGFIHHHYRRARSLSLELGSSAYWRNLLLDELLAGGEG